MRPFHFGNETRFGTFVWFSRMKRYTDTQFCRTLVAGEGSTLASSGTEVETEIDEAKKPPEATPDAVRSLTNSRTVAASAMWNLIGRLGPLLIALVVTPMLVHTLGPSRWGVFTIALSLVGIFSIFDFGIGRSLTRTISELLVDGKREEAASLAKSGIAALTVFGTAGGLLMASVARFWVDHGLHIPAAIHDEVLHAVYVLCVSAPVVLLCSALWGVLSAFQRFRSANLVNIPVMAMYYVGPLVMLHFVDSLVAVLAVLVLCRVVTSLAYWRICTNALPELTHARAHIRMLGPVMRMGGWMTASTMAWPILTYVDKFIIASVVSAAAAGYYSTPLDLVLRFSIIPIAIMNTAYPAIAASYRSDPDNTQALFRRSLLTVAGILFPAALACVALSHWILQLWLGADFAAHATVVLRWLGVGVLLTSIDTVVAGLLDGIGKASVNAKFSFAELALYIPVLAILVRSRGIEGAAMVWALRCALDLAIRMWVAQRLYLPLRPTVRGLLPVLCGILASLLATALAQGSKTAPAIAIVSALAVFALLWRSLSTGERTRLQTTAGRWLPILRPAVR